MAKRGDGESAEVDAVALVVMDLESMHAIGAAALEHSSEPSGLEHLERLTGAYTGAEIWAIVRESCTMIDPPYDQATLGYLGYSYAYTDKNTAKREECLPATAPTSRKEAAAACIGQMVPRQITRKVETRKRRYGGQLRFSSYQELMLTVAAKMIVAHHASPASEPDEPQQDAPQSKTHGGEDIYNYYKPTSLPDLRTLGFFRRNSTSTYIDDIARIATAPSARVTIFAGTGVSADQAEPLRRRFMQQLLFDALTVSDVLVGELDKRERARIIERVSAAAVGSYPAPYLGSVVRELTQGRLIDATDLQHRRAGLEAAIRELIANGYIPGRFLARAIASCAFAMRRGGTKIEILTSNYDNFLARAAEHVRTPNYLPEGLEDYRFAPRPHPEEVSDQGSTGCADNEVGVTHLRGNIDVPASPLIVGEADFFAEHNVDLSPHCEMASWRHDLLVERLENTTCIFVGNTLTDPDILKHLATTKYKGRKYALLLEPSLVLEEGPTESQGGGSSVGLNDRYVARELISRRFLHLGVIPIIADRPNQIPQFLREIALKVLQGAAYRPYGERSEVWWGYWSKAFGYRPPDGVLAIRSKALQEHWHDVPLDGCLKQLHETLTREATDKPLDERLIVEVWLRNPQARELMLWARSDSLWLDGSTVHRAPLTGASRYIAQHTFWRGQPTTRTLDSKLGHWRFSWSIPLVLHKDPWYHLPIGVLNVLSTMAEDERDSEQNPRRTAWLARAVDPERATRDTEPLEEMLKSIVLPELDPITSTWNDRERPSWEAYYKHSAKKVSRRRPGTNGSSS
jgi:hypothetical protein